MGKGAVPRLGTSSTWVAPAGHVEGKHQLLTHQSVLLKTAISRSAVLKLMRRTTSTRVRGPEADPLERSSLWWNGYRYRRSSST